MKQVNNVHIKLNVIKLSTDVVIDNRNCCLN